MLDGSAALGAHLQGRSFHSPTIGGEVGDLLYLPPGYESGGETRYPVLYWLHSLNASPVSLEPLVKRLHVAIEAGEARPMIVVSCYDPTGQSMWTDARDGTLPIATVIVSDLVPHVDATYRTQPRRRARAIEGYSMGGYGAAFLGFGHPDIFGAVSILSGALHRAEFLQTSRVALFVSAFGGDLGYAERRSPWRVVESRADSIRGRTAIRIYVGAKDFFLQVDRAFHEHLEALGLEHEWGVVDAPPHDLEALLQSWPVDLFSFYSRAFAGME